MDWRKLSVQLKAFQTILESILYVYLSNKTSNSKICRSSICEHCVHTHRSSVRCVMCYIHTLYTMQTDKEYGPFNMSHRRNIIFQLVIQDGICIYISDLVIQQFSFVRKCGIFLHQRATIFMCIICSRPRIGDNGKKVL